MNRPSQYLIHYEAGFQHKHYTGASKEFQILKELDGREGFFIKVFFVNDKVNMNKWQITWDGIKQDASDVLGVPIVLQSDLQHPNFAVQNIFAKGYIVDFVLDEDKHELSVIARILDPTVIKLIEEKKLKFVSPAVVARDSLSLDNVNGVDVLTRWIALHLAIVAVPAYGKTDAKIHGTCVGKGDTCSMKLKALTAAELANLGTDAMKMAPLTQTPLLKKSQVEEIIKREHELLDMNIPEPEVHKMIIEEFGSEEEDHDKMIHPKAASFLHYAASKLEFLKTGSIKYDGKEGYWIGAKGMKVFVSDGQTVDDAIKSQCPCQSGL